MRIPVHIIRHKKREQEKRRRDEESMRLPLIPPQEDEKIHKTPAHKKEPRRVVVIEM